MLAKLTVVKEVYQPSEPIKGKPGESYPESHSLLCLDMSEPQECRMEEMAFYRLKATELPLYWGKSVGKTLMVAIDKIQHNKTGSRASLLGRILPDTYGTLTFTAGTNSNSKH
jgi:hypothetical protein